MTGENGPVRTWYFLGMVRSGRGCIHSKHDVVFKDHTMFAGISEVVYLDSLW